MNSGAIQATNFDWHGGTLKGSGDVTVSQSLYLESWQGDARYDMTLDGRTLNLNSAGTGTWYGVNLHLLNGAVVNNSGVLTRYGGGGGIDGDGTFKNTGTFIKMDSGPVNIQVPFANSGSVDVQGGSLHLSGGTTSSGSIHAAAGTSVQFAGATVLTPSSTVNVNQLAFAAASILNFQIAGTSPALQYDHVTATGSVTLGGSFAVYLAPGITSAVGDVITVINGPGAPIAPFTGLPDGSIIAVGGYQFRINYTNGDVTLTVVHTPNSVPTANAGGPYTVVRGGTVMLDASNSSDPDQATATLTFEWDFDGDTQYDDATGMQPAFSANGVNASTTRMVGLRVTDAGGLVATTTATVQIVAVALLPDACHPGQTALLVGGTTGDDTIVINPAHQGVTVKVNGTDLGTFQPTGRVVVYSQAGDDDVQVAGVINNPCWLYGDAGDDRLKGGGGNNVLVGGAGDDLVVGGNDRDVLIGGTGADRLVGNAEDDIVIAGSTAYDGNEAALCAILDEWTSSRSYVVRIANLNGTGTGSDFVNRRNGNKFLRVTDQAATTTVFDDGAADVLTGSSGLDWFFANLTGTGVDDKITDLSAAEFANDLSFIQGL